VEAHSRDLQLEVKDPGWVHAVKEGLEGAELTVRQAAICRYAEKLTRAPTAMTREDLDALRRAGLDDADLLDLVQIVGFFNYINRVADALGVPPEPDW
jgi:uncharacterized peroxidase-related enzyme